MADDIAEDCMYTGPPKISLELDDCTFENDPDLFE